MESSPNFYPTVPIMGMCCSCMFHMCYKIYTDTCCGRCCCYSYVKRRSKEMMCYNGVDVRVHANANPFIFGSVLIQPIPSLHDNYTYLVADLRDFNYVLIDLGDSELHKSFGDVGPPDAVLTTHRHWDHSAGNIAFHRAYPEVPIVGSTVERVPRATVNVNDGDRLSYGRLDFHVIFTPGHTRGHVVYLLKGDQLGAPDSVFTGDHLFVAGCGANFECSLTTMIQSLERMRSLPDATLVWPSHEFGFFNLETAAILEPDNMAIVNKLIWAAERTRSRLSTCPSTIGSEKDTNPYLRGYMQATLRRMAPPTNTGKEEHNHKHTITRLQEPETIAVVTRL